MPIEKLDIYNGYKIVDWLHTIDGRCGAIEVNNKINELVAAVNELISCVGQLGVEFTEPNLADPYAEQRKWIGKLCWFWDDNKKDGSYGVLNYIKEGWESCYVQKGHYCSYKHCEPVKLDIIYKGGDNE